MSSSDLREGRPSPDALLAEAQREARGRLKIFLGAAPGVGKTYEMLSAAQARKRDGIDVVVGVVETHGRKETEALLTGLEVIARRQVEYRGRELEEMDLDGLLARHPQLALIDELAHTNAPGSRHPKRYMDVEELLAAGIDVYATLNIQHVESLNDVVARITRIRVRETVPDSVIDKADDIELIDLTPEDLIQRLKEGKVYVPHQAERAIRHYFAPGNLTALRELSLRRTAQRVDEQMVRYMQAHAIKGPWASHRARAGRRQRRPRQRHRGAIRAPARRPAEGALDRAARRNRAQPAHDRSRAQQRCGGAAPGPAIGRRGGDAAGPGHRRDGGRIRPRQQRDADHRGAVAARSLARDAVRIRGAAHHPQGRGRDRLCRQPAAQDGGRGTARPPIATRAIRLAAADLARQHCLRRRRRRSRLARARGHRHRQHLPAVPDRRAGQRRLVRPVARVVRLRDLYARL